MREAILCLLSNPQEAEAQTERGYQLVRQSYNSEQFVDSLATQLASLQ